MDYFFLFLLGLVLGKTFYFNIKFILYFYLIILLLYLFYFWASKQTKTN